MEFYFAEKGLRVSELGVSIPNGMEFYFPGLTITLWRYGFNSQRDGILHELVPVFLTITLFQFPTGWNSTRPILCCFWCSFVVSIPNGMEFYTRCKFISIEPSLFQFPTGWNSTILRAEPPGIYA